MQNKLTIREEDLFNNPVPRVPIALVLDTSSSMTGAPIDELNSGVKMFYEEILNNAYNFIQYINYSSPDTLCFSFTESFLMLNVE